eukprot:2041077-Rhodomonas_salina.1
MLLVTEFLGSVSRAGQPAVCADFVVNPERSSPPRLPEELDSMMQLLEAENAFAQHMREDPSKGPCTMYFLEVRHHFHFRSERAHDLGKGRGLTHGGCVAGQCDGDALPADAARSLGGVAEMRHQDCHPRA